MQKLYSSFPGGLPGTGLLLLRLTVGTSILAHSVDMFSTSNAPSVWLFSSISVVVGIAMLAGSLTPITAGLAALFYLTKSGIWTESAISALHLAVISIALFLLGPGYISIDARLFGRREILISPERETGPPKPTRVEDLDD